ncbi:helix-turn-helix transcriptional regulator, partial [Streptomyces sp. NPDC057199]|uniref:helix-turn-helix domain-containing protein n=1 Tax=Streptomyces sp. NPDC057199 TaxID=3346047 RepID=UPI0036324CCE
MAALLAKGMSNRQIPLRLVFSLRTVDFHVGNIRTNIGLRSRALIAGWRVSTRGRRSERRTRIPLTSIWRSGPPAEPAQ